MLAVFLSLFTAEYFSAKQAKLHDAVLGVRGPACASSRMESPKGREWENWVCSSYSYSYCLEAGSSPPASLLFCPLAFPVIPAAPLTLILALESAAMLPFPGVAETRQTERQLPGSVKGLPDVFGNSFALQAGDPGD